MRSALATFGLRSPFGRRRGRFTPAALFALSEPGVWFDPSPMTCFTDTAGTTPAAVGQSVALMLDKSRGATVKLGDELVTNGGFAANTDWTTGTGWAIGSGVATKTAGTAAVLSQAVVLTTGRAYELTYTLTRTAGTLTPRITGGTTVNFTARTAGGTFTQIVSAVTGNTTLEFSADASFAGTIDNVTVKELTGNHAQQDITESRPTLARVPAGGRRNLLVGTATLATQTRVVTAAEHTLSFQGTGTVTLTGASTAGPLVGTGATDTVSLTFTPTAGNLTLTVSGSVTVAQLELGAVRTGYQTVGATTFDVTEAGQADNWHLSFDGIDDSMSTPTIAPGTDKVQIFVGARKITDTGFQTLCGYGPTGTTAGEAFLFASIGSGRLQMRSGGTVLAQAETGLHFGPKNLIVTGTADIGNGDAAVRFLRVRVNGVQEISQTSNQGVGNYANHQLGVGSRGGLTTLQLNGHIYSLVTRFGPNLDTDTIEKVEKYIAGKTAGVSL
jgi:hypothetical protein